MPWLNLHSFAAQLLHILSLGKVEGEAVYKSRQERQLYAYSKYRGFLDGSALDLGCDQAILRSIMYEYVGLDMSGQPDILADLERKLPFKDDSFDCVLCLDTLEHVDNLHQLFEEMVRVTKRYIVLSLPNNWPPALRAMISGRKSPKRYGLPPEKPKDRHKWFFNYLEAEAFIHGIASKSGLSVVCCEPYAPAMSSRALRARISRRVIPKGIWNNLFAQALWAVLKKE